MTCDTIREQLLDYVYDACEDDVAVAINAHLQNCSDCAAALAAAKSDQGVLAEAAAVAAPGLQLDASTAAVAADAGAPRVHKPFFKRWWFSAAAAAFVGCVSLLGYRTVAMNRVIAQHPAIAIDGPRVLPAGAAAEFQVRATGPFGAPRQAELTAAVFNADGSKAGEAEVITTSLGASTVRIPADLGRPGEFLALQIAAKFDDSKVQPRAAIVALRDRRNLLARVSTDKPLYRPGEIVRARLQALERFKLTPAGSVPMHVKLENPKGETTQETVLPSEKGISAWTLALPADAPGGEWSIVLSNPGAVFPEVRRTFVVRSYQPPRLKKAIELDRDSYSPGGKGAAWLTVERAEGGVPEGAPCTAVVSIDGVEVHRVELKLGASGGLHVPFELPESIEGGRGLLAVRIKDGGVVETATKTIPITVDRLDVVCYPEGGALVAGLSNRVYFDLRDPLGEPADALLELQDAAGTRVARARVDVRGMGQFSFTPAMGANYKLVVVEPAGITLRGEVPPVTADGVTLRSRDVAVAPGDPVKVIVGAAEAGQYDVEAWCRGVKVGATRVELAGGEAKEVAITRTVEAGGVLRITVLDTAGVPLAERLVNAVPPHRINVRVTPERERYAPGESVTATVTTTDENGTPIPAVTGVVVVNEAVLSYAQDRDTPDLPMHFLLGLEVEELEEVQLFAEGIRAQRAVDLLLGVQGWRRFAWKDVATFAQANADNDAARAIVAAPAVESAEPISFSSAKQARRHTGYAMNSVDNTVIGVFFTSLFFILLGAMLWGLIYAGWFTFRPGSPRRGRRVVQGLLLTAGGFVAVVVMLATLILTSLGGKMAPGSMLNDMVVATGAEMKTTKDEAPGDWGGEVESEDPMEGVVNLNSDVVVRFSLSIDPQAALPDTTLQMIAELTKQLGGQPVTSYFMGMVDHANSNLDGGVGLAAAGLIASDGGRWIPAGRGDFGGPNIVLVEGRNARALMEAADQPFPGDVSRGYFATGKFFQQQAKVLVREYRHKAKARPEDDVDGSDATRSDFAEVLYWNPMLVTGADGTATIEFETCDSISAFRIGVEANDARGALAAGAGSIQNRVPFYLEPKLPVALSAGDRLLLPVAVVNDTAQPSKVEASIDVTGLGTVEGVVNRTLNLPAAGRDRVLFPITAQQGRGDMRVRIAGTGAGGLHDRSERRIAVHPRGYPMSVHGSGVIETVDKFSWTIPATSDLATLQGSVKVYPSMLATLVDGLEGMLSMPGGCFEQASSTNYPNVLALSYMAQGDNIVPSVARRSRQYLDKGYELLTSYECSKLGYEWFGADPGHAALTAYGLIEFHDMQEVFDVDPKMVERTRGWVLDLRDGKGGFVEGSKSHTFGNAPQQTINAYITWVLTEAAPNLDITKELANVEQLGVDSDDPYVLALVAAALQNAGRASAKAVLAKLATLQESNGSLMSTGTSITRSGGDNLRMETTAFATLAFLKDQRYTANAEQAIRWMMEHRKGSGRFGSTQATIMALKALVQYAKDHRRTAVDHDVTVIVNGTTVLEQHIPAGTPGVITIADPVLRAARHGANVVEMRTTGAETLPWAVGMTYRTNLPPTSDACAVRVATKLTATKVDEGATVGCRVTVTNTRNEAVPMTLVRVGLPAGLEPRLEQLKELREQGVVGFYETREREVTLYWRGLGPKSTANGVRELTLDLVARVPGTFEGPATAAYLYYDDDDIAWAAPLTAQIVPAK